ncbi:DUF3592 domain-containing protein [Pseudoduganella sp. HUAS MS19]
MTLIALVFGIIFPLVGFFAGLAPLYQQAQIWWSSRSYVAAPARVESLEQVRHLNRKQVATYWTKATFRYTFEGRQYIGGQASFYNTPERRGGYQDQLYDKLSDFRQRQSVVDVWLDPHHPERAVYDPTLTWETTIWSLPFAVLFTGFGLGAWAFIFHLWRPGRSKSIADRLREGHPILIKGTDGTALLTAFALAWNALSWPIAFIALEDMRARGFSLAAIAFLFPAVGLGLMLFTCRQLRNRWLAGRPVLEVTGIAPLRGCIHFRPAIGQRSPPLELMHHLTISLKLMKDATGGRKEPIRIWEHCLRDGPVARGTQALSIEVDPPRERMREQLVLVLEVAGTNFTFRLPRSGAPGGAPDRLRG